MPFASSNPIRKALLQKGVRTLATRKLLLADDSVTIQKVVNLTFADEGMEVTSVGDGNRAVQKLEEIMPDIVLADVHMPGLNGYEVCSHIKQNPALSNIPVILLVGSFEPFDEDEARRVGADDYLTKPFQSIRQLVGRVNSLLPEQPVVDAMASTDEFAHPEPVEYIVVEPATDEAETLQTEAAEIYAPAPTPTFSDSAIDDELLEATSVSDSSDVSSRPPTYSGAPRETARMSAEDLKEFNVDLSAMNSMPSEYGEVDLDAAAEYSGVDLNAPPPSQDYLNVSQPEREREETIPSARLEDIGVETPATQPAPAATVETTAVATTASPYSTTPLSEDVLLELGAADAFAEELEDEDSILDLGDDLYGVSAPTSEKEYAPAKTFNVESGTSVAPATETETPIEEHDDMPSYVETVYTTPVIETISAPISAPVDLERLSPEMIDAIARRVVELMSDRVVREIAWEVVPELADLHIKRKMQEKKF
jgi:CheY-like chemotaxis protein